MNTLTSPPLGLLLDLDGPIASPVDRRIAIPSILSDLVALAGAGVPIAFITGRADAFVRAEIIAPLMAAGLAPDARVFCVCEKGGVWFPVTADGAGENVVDESVALPVDYTAEVRELVAAEYADTMFFDDAKVAMISAEARVDVTPAAYREAQARFGEACFEMLVARGIGARLDDRVVPDAAGGIPYRVDQTIISTDIESVKLDKDRGAERALEYFAAQGPLPFVWRSVGDSRSDYLMADHLHEAGYEVAHVDVRPSDGILERPYPVITEGDLIHDEAGAAFLRHWVEKLGLR